jgi:hypothetical protein
MNTFPYWLPAVSAVCLLFGSALMLWGLEVAPVSNPFTLIFLRDRRPEEVEERPGPGGISRGHPWAVTWGAVLFLLGLVLAVVRAVWPAFWPTD